MSKPVKWTFATIEGQYPVETDGKVAWVRTFERAYDWADRHGGASKIIGIDAQNNVVAVIGMRNDRLMTRDKVGGQTGG